ncbi:hypothetical protein T265_07840 [Opisthorchis viverrini]|uniref:Uncharacterized protein n=1 Tax=Opisthorchis viverrini TaxID=6198 RepID=A0A074ZME2_OPIVI|nr:hypothetical protein T265_07840 [Opisthorchis viverrini]KER24530.1 hypothetical protein T265_07840 [Opisthorchis viverrini]
MRIAEILFWITLTFIATVRPQAKYYPVGKFTEVDDEEFVNIDEYDVEIDEDDLNLDDDEEFPFIEHANDDLDEETEDGDVDSYEAVTPVTPVIEDRTNPRSSNLTNHPVLAFATGTNNLRNRRLITPPLTGAHLRAALVVSCFLGAFPSVLLRAVCLVHAMYVNNSEYSSATDCTDVTNHPVLAFATGTNNLRNRRLITPPLTGAHLRAALVVSCFLGAFPSVLLRAVCLVHAMSVNNSEYSSTTDSTDGTLQGTSLWTCSSLMAMLG